MPLSESSLVPTATYRVQLHAKFAFHDLEALVPYFHRLGISDFYLSPIFTATPGSQHGYDVTDYGEVNPELGGDAGFDRLAARLRGVHSHVLLDFVPNHMGIAGVLNRWWRDVLECGRLSPYAAFFDIQWKEETDRGRPRVLVPVLEDHYGRVLAQGKIRLAYGDEFSLQYADIALPVSPGTYLAILEPVGAAAAAGDDRPTLGALLADFAALPRPATVPDQATAQQRADEVDRLKRDLARVIAARPALQDLLARRLRQINGTAGDAASFDELHALIERQHYRLARWQTGAHEINYRRFFAIDSLVGLHMEKAEVFRECHELLGRLIRDGKVAGLRIDHIDGLRQPGDYLRRLQSLPRPDRARPLYVLVEKILARDELLPEEWPVHGTTGYEFILQLSDVLVHPAALARFDEVSARFTGETSTYPQVVYEKKRLIISEMFVNAVNNLGVELVEILAADRNWRDLTRHELTNAVSELMANFPRYRTYRQNQRAVSPQDRQVLEEACAQALARNPRANPQPFEFVRDLLSGTYPEADAPAEYRARLLSWSLTFQQYTGAVMAKAVEDTAFYTYNRLIALNEVGGDPGSTVGSLDGFHRANSERLARSPRAMLTTSTHDTKFSEDVRARLYALADLADEWEGWVLGWKALTLRHTTPGDRVVAPDPADLYRFFQVLLGAWPLAAEDVNELFRARLREHFRKAVNEAKRHTSILQANEAYLEACDRFVGAVTDPRAAPDFLRSFVPCAGRVARSGMVNSLTQLVLKCTVPGVPDFYQGNETWDFSLVDPDNRREVDFARRQQLLAGVADVPVARLLENWRDGGIKLRVTQILLEFRGQHPGLFSDGAYRPIECTGAFCDHVIAFSRHDADHNLLVAVPRLTAKLGAPPLGLVWDDTQLDPGDGAETWQDIFTGQKFSGREPLWLRALFAELPCAALRRL